MNARKPSGTIMQVLYKPLCPHNTATKVNQNLCRDCYIAAYGGIYLTFDDLKDVDNGRFVVYNHKRRGNRTCEMYLDIKSKKIIKDTYIWEACVIMQNCPCKINNMSRRQYVYINLMSFVHPDTKERIFKVHICDGPKFVFDPTSIGSKYISAHGDSYTIDGSVFSYVYTPLNVSMYRMACIGEDAFLSKVH